MSDRLYRDAPQTDHRCFIKQPNHKRCWVCASVRKFVVPVTEPLLTREEAANDPEVIKTVLREQWGV